MLFESAVLRVATTSENLKVWGVFHECLVADNSWSSGHAFKIFSNKIYSPEKARCTIAYFSQ